MGLHTPSQEHKRYRPLGRLGFVGQLDAMTCIHKTWTKGGHEARSRRPISNGNFHSEK